MEQTWYHGLYFLRCVSKPGVVSPWLFASLTTGSPAWHGDFHTNYNITVPVAPVFPWDVVTWQARLRPNGTLTLNRWGAPFNNFGHYTEQF